MDSVFSALPNLMISFVLGSVVMYLISRIMNENNENKKRNKTNANTTKTRLQSEESKPSNKPVRVYVDGCWDVMHSGHYNALRQAKALGDILVVGVHSDEEIARNKREPVMNNEQRMAAVKACKWADEIVFGVPYAPTLELIDKHRCDYIAHGDDIPMAANGQSAYHDVMSRLKIFRRTPGVSTTHLIQRLLDAAKHGNDHENKQINNYDDDKKRRITAISSNIIMVIIFSIILSNFCIFKS
eukprot:457730_1